MRTHVIDWSYYKGDVPGYGDCRAVPGEYACLLPDRHVESFLGIAALPGGENINYLRIPRNPGDGRMAGGGQTTKPDPAYEWQWPAGWVKVGLMYGPNAVIYGAGDTLVAVTSREEYQRTAGWRYLNTLTGGLVDCQSTHDDEARGLYEWTEWPDIAIGQGGKPDMGAVVLFTGEPLRRLDPRPDGQRSYPFNARFMHSDRHGDLFGITIVDLVGRKTYFVWATLAELRALPAVAPMPVPPIPPQPPTPPKPPAPPKPPTTEPNPMPDLNLKAEVQAERAKYPTPLDEHDPAKILNAVAWRENLRTGRQEWGLSVKPPPGNRVPSPQGVDVAYDILHHRVPADGKPHGRLFDALTGDLKGVVTWGETDYHNDPGGRPWLAPVDPGVAPVPAPVPTPGPAPSPPAGLPASLHDWIHGEYPQLVAAYASRHGGNDPGHEWSAFQTYRRYVEAWSLARMLAHELAQ